MDRYPKTLTGHKEVFQTGRELRCWPSDPLYKSLSGELDCLATLIVTRANIRGTDLFGVYAVPAWSTDPNHNLRPRVSLHRGAMPSKDCEVKGRHVQAWRVIVALVAAALMGGDFQRGVVWLR